MSRITLVASLLVLLAHCALPPHLILRIEDPDGNSGAATSLYLGTDAASLRPVELRRALAFPTQITVQAPDSGEQALLVEARVADGAPVGRGTSTVRFKRRGTPTATIILKKVCTEDAQCQKDETFCDGTGFCRHGVCEYEDAPCSSDFGCVISTCDELHRRCVVTVDHGA